MSSLPKKQRVFAICTVLIGLTLGYVLAESVATFHSRYTWKGTSLFLFDESGKTIHFDPVRGYRLTTQPSRWARITNGKTEYIGLLRGNAQGFPSRSDYQPSRAHAGTLRIGVFGDSFTAGEFLETNWPDRTTAVARAHGDDLELLNFAVDGAGLANWWSVLTRFVEPQHYDLDGLIFLVFSANLERKFVVAEHGGSRRHMFGRCESWDPREYPTTLADARKCMEAVKGGYIVSDSEFDGALKGKWPASVPRPPMKFVLANRISTMIHNAGQPTAPPPPPAKFEKFAPGQLQLIEDIGSFIKRHKVHAMVVFLPERDELVGSTWREDPWRGETITFANMIGADFRDAAQAFKDLSPAEIRSCFFPYDYHWNQRGSDHFSDYILQEVQTSFGRPTAISSSVSTPKP